MPLISVIIPVHNGEKTIRATVESVLAQTFSDLEVLIINDGSTDTTCEIVAGIKDRRVRVFSYPNAGPSASRNRGIALAKGEYIAFLDADDLWTPDKVETQLHALQANPQAAVAYSWTNLIDEAGRFLEPHNRTTATGDVLAHLLQVNFVVGGSNPLTRKSALTELGGFDETLDSTEDYDMYLRLAAHYHFVAVPIPQVLYRRSSHSISTNVNRMEKTTLKVIERAFRQAPISLQSLKQQSLANNYRYLTFRALNNSPVQRDTRTTVRFFWRTLKNETSWRSRVSFVCLFLFNATIIVLFPYPLSQSLITKLRVWLKTRFMKYWRMTCN